MTPDRELCLGVERKVGQRRRPGTGAARLRPSQCETITIIRRLTMLAFPWVKSTRETKRLKVFNKAESWTVPVGAALRSFNNLALGVTVVAEKEEQNANVALVLGAASRSTTRSGSCIPRCWNRMAG